MAGANTMRALSKLHVIVALAFAAVMVAPGSAVALDPSERLDNPALESRARDLSAELRCLVCQNQSIDDSDAPLARDLRLLVRERLAAGDSNAEVKSFLVARYGDFVLLKPPFGWNTVLLWLTPLLVLLAALAFVLRAANRVPVVVRDRSTASRLTNEEERRLSDLMQVDAANRGSSDGGTSPAEKN